MSDLYDFKAPLADGRLFDFASCRGKVVLAVNVASACGFTPQYAGLQQLHERYKDRGLVIVGFPCNQFGAQEPGTETEIARFCDLNFGVTFPLFKKVLVNGRGTDPVIGWLKAKGRGVFGTRAVKWNFTKFLVSRDGRKVKRFASTIEPEAMVPMIESLLAAQPAQAL
jgi:glutathione peroxidase